MGRHSAPDDDVEVGGDTVLVAPPEDARARSGRHAHGSGAADAELEANTAQITPIVDPILDEPLPAATTTVIAPISDTDDVRLVDDLLADPVDDTPLAGDTVAEPAQSEPDAKPPKPPKTKKQKAPKAEKPPKIEKAPRAEKAPKVGKPKRPEPHVSDRTLLARDSAARARVVAAVVVPFVLYVGVLLALGSLELRTALLWIWVPLITAGVMAGLILDLAHRAAAARAITALEDKA